MHRSPLFTIKHVSLYRPHESINNMRNVVAGFSIVDSHDQYVIFRLGWIQVMGLVAALNLYDAEAHRFSKDIVDQSLPAPNPLGRFSDSLLDYAQKIHALRLNTIEAALVTSLVVMATGEWRECRLFIL